VIAEVRGKIAEVKPLEENIVVPEKIIFCPVGSPLQSDF
jgi:hypothetical protein